MITPSANILLMVRELLGVSVMRMYKYLKVPASTYISYENMQYNPNSSFLKLYRDKLGVNLSESIRKDKICYADFSIMEKVLRDPTLHYNIPVYLYHTIQDVLFGQYYVPPSFKIVYARTALQSLCLRVKERFIFCRPTYKIIPGFEYLVILKDGTDVFSNNPKALSEDTFRMYVIINELTEEEVMEKCIESGVFSLQRGLYEY
jgi:transcriptional regulator with XRE-family HTH domain